MCFGSSQTSSTTTTPSPALTSAAQQNLGYAQNLQTAGFSPYTGQQVANFAPQQQTSFGGANNIVGAVSPTLGLATSGLSNYMTGAGNQPTVSANTISSAMSPYMNNYVSQALAPQVSNLNNQLALQSQLTQGAATSAGAFGDPRATMLQQNQNAAGSLQEQGLVGNAYTSAFNTAIGAGAQDVANNLNAQTTNAGLYNTGLNEQLAGANAILGANTNAATLQNTFGQQQTAQSQAQLNAQYNQWLMAQQYPFQTTGLVNSTLGAAAGVSPTTQTQTSPNNSGYGLLGSALGAVGSAAGGYFTGQGTTALATALSDPKAKENAKQVGELYDGTPVHAFNYKGSPQTQIGLMAPDVEKRIPDAVHKIGGLKHVDYSLATRRAAKLAHKAPHDGLAAALGIAA